MKLFGGIMLVLGTCIGAGLLGLPVATAQEGFATSSILLVTIWLLMTISAFLLLEVNLALPMDSNLISMARKCLGPTGELLTWVAYLLLLYSLLCAYIATSADMLGGWLEQIHLVLPSWLLPVVVVLLLGYVVYRGIYSVDLLNRGLMSAKLIIFALIILALAPHVHLSFLNKIHHYLSINALMVISTSFGFAIILPSLRTYFASDLRMLKKTIFIGSLIPLIYYLAWVASVHGVLPSEGRFSLAAMLNSSHSTSDLTQALTLAANNIVIVSFIHIFVSICAITSFLGVSLALTDFLSDGLGLEKRGSQGAILYLLTFLPPLVIIMYLPGAFISALSYAGIFCVFVLMFLPAWMAWGKRYGKKKTELTKAEGYQFPLNKMGLVIVMLSAITLMGWSVIDKFLNI